MKSISTILMFVAGLILLGWIARPLWDDIQSLRGQTANINGILSTLNEKKQYQQNLIEKYNSITDEQLDKLLNQHLPKKPDTGTMLIALERITTASDSRLNNIDFKKIEQSRSISLVAPQPKATSQTNESKNYQELSFSFNVTSSYENFKALLRALEKNIRLIDIQTISFGSGSKNTYVFTLSATTYFRQ
ncbi:MAG: hypothetical protein AAB795_02110 [Patescibacteria group bacterium]